MLYVAQRGTDGLHRDERAKEMRLCAGAVWRLPCGEKHAPSGLGDSRTKGPTEDNPRPRPEMEGGGRPAVTTEGVADAPDGSTYVP